jgi:hypothetical protein
MPCRQEQVPKISKNNVCVQFFTIFAPLKIQLYAPTRTLDPPPPPCRKYVYISSVAPMMTTLLSTSYCIPICFL